MDVRDRSLVGDCPGRLVKFDRQARVPHGAAASSFREEGLDRAADRDPVLDHLDCAGACGPLYAETAMIPLTSFAENRVALFGLGASGLASASALLAGGADVVAFDDSDATIE